MLPRTIQTDDEREQNIRDLTVELDKERGDLEAYENSLKSVKDIKLEQSQVCACVCVCVWVCVCVCVCLSVCL
jgi:hypothetical protein